MLTSTVQTEIEKFLGMGTVPLYIGGAWRAPHGGSVLEVQDPADGTLLAEVAAGLSADVDDAVAAANRAPPGLVRPAPGRPGYPPPSLRRRHRGQPRAAGQPRVARRGQASVRGHRLRHTLCGPSFPLLRRPFGAHPPVFAAPGGSHGCPSGPGAIRPVWFYLSLELPVPLVRVGRGPSLGGREYGRGQARGANPAHHPLRLSFGGASGYTGRRHKCRARAGGNRWRRPRSPYRHPSHVVYGVARGRPGGGHAGGPQLGALQAGARG